jgi:N-alpha-acetyl-L-2,4-diaminobutyrate deacetylase
MTVAIPSPVTCTIDLGGSGADGGVRHGYLMLPHSSDDSAWGSVMTPISVLRNGDGPTALLLGGNHGDEYEGQVALRKLAATLDPAAIAGRVIIVPSLNLPAARAGRRVSPLDEGNLNRSFPGRPDGTPTQKLADYYLRHLLPLGNLIVDLHSGGRTLDFLPFAASHELPDAHQQARCAAARDAFGAPVSLLLREMDGGGMLDGEAEALGAVFVTTELGGGGTITRRTVEIAERGLRNVLAHAGILRGPGATAEGPSPTSPAAPAALRLAMPGDDCYVVSESEGLVEPCADLGDVLERGQPVARVWDLQRSGTPPREYGVQRDGVLIGRHFPGLVRMGDCLACLGVPVRAEDAARARAQSDAPGTGAPA